MSPYYYCYWSLTTGVLVLEEKILEPLEKVLGSSRELFLESSRKGRKLEIRFFPAPDSYTPF